MRHLTHFLMLVLIGIGLVQVWPIIKLHYFADGEQVEGTILAFDLIPKDEGFLIDLIFSYEIETDEAHKSVLSSQLADISGDPVEEVWISGQEAKLYEMTLEYSDAISKIISKPVILVDRDKPLETGRMYFPADTQYIRTGMLSIAIPVVLWVLSLLLRSYVLFHREPIVQKRVNLGGL